MDEILLQAMLSSPRAPSACAKACDSDEPLRPSPGPAAPRVSRSCAAASFLGTPLRVAFSSSRLVKPDRHYCRERADGLPRPMIHPYFRDGSIEDCPHGAPGSAFRFRGG